MKLYRKVTIWLVALACLTVGGIAGCILGTVRVAISRETLTQLMWFGFYAKQDMLVEDIYLNEPPSDAVGALLSHSRIMDDDKMIILANSMLGTNYFCQSMYFLNARLSRLYGQLDRPEYAARHMSNAVAIVAEWKGISRTPSEVLKDVQTFDSMQVKHQQKSQQRGPGCPPQVARPQRADVENQTEKMELK